MSLYDAFKDVMNMAQKADNIDLYRQLLDLGAQALDLQAEVARLREENNQLKEEMRHRRGITRHKSPFITLEDENIVIPYCAQCYGKAGVFIQMFEYDDASYRCPECGLFADKE